MSRVARASLAALLSAALAGACAGQRPATPDSAGVPPGVAEREPTLALDGRCATVAGLAAAGDHKPAVDEMALLGAAGATCPQPILDAVEGSRSLLMEADVRILEARQREEQADLAGARESLRLALEVYPRYHWAAKLARDLEARITEEVARLRRQAADSAAAGDSPAALEILQRAAVLDPASPAASLELEALRDRTARRSLDLARRAEQTGDLGEAGRRLEQALAAVPAEAGLRQEILESARLVGLKLYSAGELSRARDLWRSTLALDAGNPKILDYLRDVEERLRSLDRIKQGDDG